MELKKCFKSFLMAKKLIDSDKDKSFEYFKQSLKYINLAKKNVNDKDLSDLLEETETECNKYLILTIESSINNIKKNSSTIKLL